MSKTKPIPVSAAEAIAKKYGYDQVIILARYPDSEHGMEHLTTYGVTRAHCKIAGDIGRFLRDKIMRWGTGLGWVK